MYSLFSRTALRNSRSLARRSSTFSRRQLSAAAPVGAAVALGLAGYITYTFAPPISMESPIDKEQLAEKADKPVETAEHDDEKGAYDPETGEINWDCPCLGGMAHGPCGEEFKAAFSCFVYSKEEPKGIDCIEKFKGMQECFKKYPEVYAEELREDDEYGQVPETQDVGEQAEVAVTETVEAVSETVSDAATKIAGKAEESVGQIAEKTDAVVQSPQAADLSHKIADAVESSTEVPAAVIEETLEGK
ncbi:hypothetical protein KL930_002584 [Ogataea haglerorum]|nr:hypothetical protein KL951_002707 [Ogataea haglerorum]KAG7778497.1 hypothetical protein KL930_002584 [Ogataea haglerorum]KAG7779183.1 hypothetical protein KL922_001668 [Ogataea haglerorum]